MSILPIDLAPYFRQLESLDPMLRTGEVVELTGAGEAVALSHSHRGLLRNRTAAGRAIRTGWWAFATAVLRAARGPAA